MKEPEQGQLKGCSDVELPENLKACKDGRCIHELVKLASTQFERQITSELINMEIEVKENLTKIKSELKWLRYLILALFGAIIIIKLIGG